MGGGGGEEAHFGDYSHCVLIAMFNPWNPFWATLRPAKVHAKLGLK
jgi:hypothetical protein